MRSGPSVFKCWDYNNRALIITSLVRYVSLKFSLSSILLSLERTKRIYFYANLVITTFDFIIYILRSRLNAFLKKKKKKRTLNLVLIVNKIN